MWQLDVNMPRKAAAVLGAYGIEAHATESRGWRALTNGAPVEVAVEAGFQCILTRDSLFSESAARALKRFPDFCVVLVTIPQLRSPEFLRLFQQFQQAWDRTPIQLAPGHLVRWPES